MEIKGEIDKATIIERMNNTILSISENHQTKKINKNMKDLKSKTNKPLDLLTYVRPVHNDGRMHIFPHETCAKFE